MIDRTQFAVSTDATRYHLNGVFFEHLENGVMRMTATDGHRLSFVDQEVFLKMPELKRGIIIPKKGLTELRKLLAEGSSTVGLSFERGYIFAKQANTFLFVRLIDGEYPDYRVVIPKSTDRVVKMDRESFQFRPQACQPPGSRKEPRREACPSERLRDDLLEQPGHG